MTQFDHDSGRGDGLRSDGPFITGSSALLAAIVHSASDAIIGMDLHGTVLSWNDAATRLLGHSASDMIGRQISRIIPYDRRREQETLLSRIREGSDVPMFETMHLGASGHEIAVTVTPSPVFDGAGAIIAASFIVRERGAGRRDARASWPYMLAAPSSVKRNILVVEDEALIGLGLAAMLENSGFDVLGPAGDVKTATALLDRHDCSLAILDINLGSGETSAPLAERLKQDGVPFFVTSGYLADSQPAIFGEVPSFPKPVRVRSLVAAVHEVLG